MKLAMNKQQLAAKIWAGANALRGKVSANSYKDYMLGLIFYKYLSEKEENYLKDKLFFEDDDLRNLNEEDTKTVENCQKNIGYFIEYKNLFSFWKMPDTDKHKMFPDKDMTFTVATLRASLSAFNRLIGVDYRKVYNGIFDTLEKGLDTLGTMDSDRTKAVSKLTDLINEIPTDGSQDYDVLGFIYEFLLKNFAANAGKAGEFYTPYEASTVMSEIIAHHLKDRKEISIYDPTSGSGSLLINIGKAVSKHMGEANKVKYYAQELISETYNLTRMNLIMRDILPNNIIARNGDTLSNDWPFFEEGSKEYMLKTYNPCFVDGCCSNPPYSQNWGNDDASFDVRFKDYGVAPKSKADYAFLLHNLYHLKSDGIMTIVMPHGVLFRGGEEGKIRQNLIEKNNIETIIGLPVNIFFGTSIPTIIMVLKKDRASSDVLFVDASKGFIKDGNKNRLQAKDVKKIVATVLARSPSEEEKSYARLVSKDEIVKNEYNLNIPRYLDSSEKPEIWDIYASIFGGIPNVEINELKDYWCAFPTLRNKLFETKNIPYSNIKVEDIGKSIKENTDVIKFNINYKNALIPFPDYLKEELVDNCLNLAIPKEEKKLAEKLREVLSTTSLVNYYDAYQILDNSWNEIALDLELLQLEGFSALTLVDPNMVIKKNNKTKEIVEVQEGWIGHILPFDLIQEVYYKSSKEKLGSLFFDLADWESQKTTLLESIDPADKAELLKEDSEDIETKKLNAVIAKIKKELKKGAEYDESSYEDIIIKINDLNTKISQCKKDIKTLNTKLVEDTKEKIEGMSRDESLSLLVEKWIKPLLNELNGLSSSVINDMEEKVIKLQEKYTTTYKNVSDEINSSKLELATMIDELNGDEFDIKGLEEFKKLLGGDKHE
jgi:type I restriction enzyme M protein